MSAIRRRLVQLDAAGRRRSWKAVLGLGAANVAAAFWLLFALRWSAFDGLPEAARIALLVAVKVAIPVAALVLGVLLAFAAGTLYWRQEHVEGGDPFEAARRALGDDSPPDSIDA